LIIELRGLKKIFNSGNEGARGEAIDESQKPLTRGPQAGGDLQDPMGGALEKVGYNFGEKELKGGKERKDYP